MLYITVKGNEYGVEIKNNKYGSIINIFEGDMVWITDIFDLSLLDTTKGNLFNYVGELILETLADQEEMIGD